MRENCKYDVQLKLLTKGRGAHVVINCINGIEHINACMECISLFGQYIEIIDNYYPEDSKLGILIRLVRLKLIIRYGVLKHFRFKHVIKIVIDLIRSLHIPEIYCIEGITKQNYFYGTITIRNEENNT